MLLVCEGSVGHAGNLDSDVARPEMVPMKNFIKLPDSKQRFNRGLLRSPDHLDSFL